MTLLQFKASLERLYERSGGNLSYDDKMLLKRAIDDLEAPRVPYGHVRSA